MHRWILGIGPTTYGIYEVSTIHLLHPPFSHLNIRKSHPVCILYN